MSSRKRPLLLVPLLFFVLACQIVSGSGLQATAPSLQYTTPASPSTPSPTFTPLPTFTLTPTVLPPTATVTATPTIVPTPSALQLRVFEKLWRIVRDTYLYPDFNGLDWEAVGEEYRQRVEAGLTNDDFYAAMEEMIYRLGDDHSVFLPPEDAAAESAEFAGENDYVGIGVLTTVVPQRKRVTILVVFPASPAERAGLQPHDNILAVDGKPIVDENGYHRNLLRGPENSTITLTVQSPGGAPRQVEITRQRVTGAVPVPYTELATPEGKRVGYILLITFGDETVDDQVEQALKALTASAPLDGLIIDNRQNGGGADEVARGVLGFFTSGTLGHFVDRKHRRRAFNVIGSDINGSSKVPLVVMVGSGTVSFGEIFAGVLRDTGRAYIIGETTEGNLELLWGYDFEDGSRAWIAHETFQPRRHPEENWEQSGIVPDLIVPVNWDEVTLENDPAIQAALEYFDGIE